MIFASSTFKKRVTIKKIVSKGKPSLLASGIVAMQIGGKYDNACFRGSTAQYDFYRSIF